jgi:hypothetical protein
MGGYSSGKRFIKADTVEDSRALDLRLLAREEAFCAWYHGIIRWTRSDQETASIGFVVKPFGNGGLRLWLGSDFTRTKHGGMPA